MYFLFGFSISFKLDTKNYNIKILKSNLLNLKKLIVALAGPMVNLIFIFAFLNFYHEITLAYINLLIFIFNMFPIYPLDGGRILKYILCILIRKEKIVNHNKYSFKYSSSNTDYCFNYFKLTI